MFRIYVCVILLGVMCHAVIGQDREDFPDEWEPQLLPNPANSPDQCNIESKSGYLCDPDRLLSPRSEELIDWLLRGFYENDTVCPCSTYWCEKTRKGTRLAIALIRKMKLADTFSDPDVAVMQAASNFALKLQEDYWASRTDCDNDVVILFSKDDGVLFISYGKTVAMTMNNNMVEYIQRRYGHHFKNGGDLFTGLVEIILAMRQVMSGYNIYDPDSPHFENPIGGASHVAPGVLATVILALLSRHVFVQ